MLYLGVDLHKAYSFVALVNGQGEVLAQQRLANEEVVGYLGELTEPALVVLEATGNWQYMYDALEGKARAIYLAHPQKVKAIAAAKVKTDKIDATILAHLLRADLLPTAYIPPREVRDGRDLVRHRARLVRMRTQLKNRVHAILSKYGLRSPCSDLFGRRGREFMAGLKLRPYHCLAVDDYLALIDELNKPIKEVSREIARLAKESEAARLLMTIPGIGYYSAMVILMEIGAIERFPDAKSLCAYAGIVPSTKGSGGRIRHGRITKEGSAWLRWVLVEAAQKAPQGSLRLRRLYQRVARRRGKAVARVAVVHEILNISWYMLKRGEPYQERPYRS